jgi:hypothetical protein
MKKIIILFTILAMSSCSMGKVDMAEAMKTAENAMALISEKKYDELSKLFSYDFYESEPKEAREKKFEKIIDVAGKLIEFHLTDSLRENNVILKYAVKHANTTTTETYTIVQEEGKYLISDINISNQ